MTRIFGSLNDEALLANRSVATNVESDAPIAEDPDDDFGLGGVGDDVIIGTGEADFLFGNDGNDTLLREAGNDDIHGGNGDDVIEGGEGDDRLFDDAGNDRVFAGAGNDSIFGDDGDDLLDGGDGNDQVFGGFGNDAIVDASGNNRLDGGSGNDVVTGGAGNDTVIGNEGNDTLLGGDGADSLSGGNGNDHVIVDNDAFKDTFDGGKGADIIDFSELSAGVTYTINKTVTINGVADTTKGFEGVVGTNFADNINAHTFIEGGAGADTITTNGVTKTTFAYAEGDGGDTIVTSFKSSTGAFVTPFAVGRNKFDLDADSFGLEEGAAVRFQNVARDGEGTDAGLVDVEGGNNVYVLQGGFENAGQAADALANALSGNDIDEGAGFFVYFNVNQQRSRLFEVDDLDDVDSAITLLANIGLDDGSNAASVDFLLPFLTANEFLFT